MVSAAVADIRDAVDEAALRAAWPVVAQLRPHLDEDRFVAQAQRQLAEGWRATVLKTAQRKHLPAVVDQLIFQWAAKEAHRLREWERLPDKYKEARKLWKPLYNAVRNIVFSDHPVALNDPPS